MMSNEVEIEKLKMARILDELDAAAGDGTSLITLMIAAGGSIAKTKQKLICEESTAAQIKSRV
jgi:peptide subunit release factor 1 (eRF1)